MVVADELTCAKPGCGVAFDYSGRGRRPKFCETHRQGKDKVTPTSRRASTTTGALRLELLQMFQGMGALVMAVDKYDGAVIISSAEKLTEALISMAEVNPAFMKFLQSGTKSMVWLQLGTALAGVIVPIAAHHRMLPLDPVKAYELFHGNIPATVKPEPDLVVVTMPGADEAPDQEAEPGA